MAAMWVSLLALVAGIFTDSNSLVLQVDNCPFGWEQHNASCYHFSHDKEEWANALKLCERLGGHLAEINSAQEGEYLSKQADDRDKSLWLGAEDLIIEGEWQWVTSKMVLNMSGYTKWDAGHPESSSDDCLEIRSNGFWNDETCTDLNYYICERHLLTDSVIG